MKAARAPVPASHDDGKAATDIRAGLTAKPRWLPCYLLYDALGSQLFEAITELPEYYLTRTELALLRERAAEIAARAGAPPTVVELGAGTGTKTRTILDAVVEARGGGTVTYYPIDVSQSALDMGAHALARPELEIRPLVGQYSDWLPAIKELPGPRLVLFIGSSIGNYHPHEAEALLRQARSGMTTGDSFLLGADLRKDEETLVAAYDDPAGVTSAFSKNVLGRINREFEADFDLHQFRHVARWNPDESRMELYLESLRDQVVTVGALGLEVSLGEGERIHTENSYKLPLEVQLELLRSAGFEPEKSFLSDAPTYALHLAHVA